MQSKAVIFDLDGTLFDHSGSVQDALRTWLPTIGMEPTPEGIARWFSLEERHYDRWTRGEISFKEQRRERMRDFLTDSGRKAMTDDELDAEFERFLYHYRAAWRPFEDVDVCIEALTAMRLRLAVVTNGQTDQQRAKLRSIKLLSSFDQVVTSEAVGVAKPEAAIYVAACDAMSLAPEECLFVGDNYELDVLGPRHIGMPAVHLARVGQTEPPDDLRITSLAQLPGLITA